MHPDLGKKTGLCNKNLQLCATVSFLQQPSLCKENLERLRNSLVFETTKSLQKSLELCATVMSVLQHLHTFPHPCTQPLLDAVLNQQSFAKKQVDTLRNHTQSLLG